MREYNFNNIDFDSIFNSFLNGSNTSVKVYRKNLSEDENEEYELNTTKDGAYLCFETPGFNKNNLTVELQGSSLIIEGKRTYKINGQEKVKTFSKKFRIGDNHNQEQIEATIEDGILTIFIPNYKKTDVKKINLL